MIYICLFFATVTFTYLLCKRIFKNPKPIKLFTLRYSGFELPNTILLPTLFLGVVAADYFLLENGMFIMVAQQQSYFGPFAGIIKIMSSFKWLLLLYCGYLVKTNNSTKYVLIFYLFILLPYNLLAGFVAGSRGQILYPIVILIYSHFHFFKKLIPIGILAIPFVFLLFPIMGAYRGMDNPDIFVAYEQTLEEVDIATNVLIVALDRLTQLGPINVAIEEINKLPTYSYRSDYLFNIIGLIPRLLWPNKPSPLNTNEYGVQMDILDPQNYNTSIGFDVVGESFIQLGYLGLIIGVFQALIFWFINFKIDTRIASGFILAFTLGFLAATQGTYINIIPTFISTIVVALPFLFLFNKKKYTE